MANQITYTGKIGAGVTLTAKVFSNVTRLDLDFNAEVATIWQGDLATPVTLTGVTTFTDTISGTNHTIVIS